MKQFHTGDQITAGDKRPWLPYGTKRCGCGILINVDKIACSLCVLVARQQLNAA